MTKLHQLASLGLLSTLAISLAFCAPQQPQQQQQPQASSAAPPTTSTTPASSTSTTTTSSPPSTSGAQAVDPEQTSGTQEGQNENEANQEQQQANQQQQDGNLVDLGSLAEIFDGKSPFGDDSLWQIPIHLVRDLTTAADGGNSHHQAATLTPAQANALAGLGSEDSAADGGDGDGGLGALGLVAIPTAAHQSQAQTVITRTQDLKTAAGYHYPTHGGHHEGEHHGGNDHHYGHGDYFQYVSVPKPYAWEFGFRRGNPYHTIERHEHGKGPHFQTKVKWSDKKSGGYGVHVWDYNHDDHHGHHQHHYDHDDHHEKHHDKHHQHYPKHHYGHH